MIIQTLIDFTLDILNSPLVRYISEAFFIEPLFQFIDYLTLTYVTFYAFITDDIPTFLITVFLFVPFNDWVFSLIYSIVVNSYAFSS